MDEIVDAEIGRQVLTEERVALLLQPEVRERVRVNIQRRANGLTISRLHAILPELTTVEGAAEISPP